ncbi:hypothetical protein V2J52_16740 [Georgenia sp. MJ173]|uniref:hypothetical protein n=1 Tax=Georgenia sunbinii TaxID=3117728 RepID=UPI002F26ACF8
MTQEEGGLEDVGVHLFRVGPAYVEHWLHELEHWRPSPAERTVVESLRDALLQLLELRDAVQRARGEFGPVSVFYPQNYPSINQKHRLYRATVDYYQQFYAAADKLTNVMRRHRDVFANVPHRSVAKFLTWLEPFAMFPEESLDLLESARRFRALINHSSSFQLFDWHTVSTEQFYVRVVFVGEKSSTGFLPEGSTPIDGPEDDLAPLLLATQEEELDEGDVAEFRPGWYFIAPDEDLVTWALCVQLNSVMQRIAITRDNSPVVTCDWRPTLTGDDVRTDYPIFAATSGVMAGSWTTEFATSATVYMDDTVAPEGHDATNSE